jgi:hypothetical protein
VQTVAIFRYNDDDQSIELLISMYERVGKSGVKWCEFEASEVRLQDPLMSMAISSRMELGKYLVQKKDVR